MTEATVLSFRRHGGERGCLFERHQEVGEEPRLEKSVEIASRLVEVAAALHCAAHFEMKKALGATRPPKVGLGWGR
jgi:hypothetical protein